MLESLSPNRIKKWKKLGASGKNKFNKRCYLHLEQQGKCFFCQKELRLGHGTLDHYYPKSKGGKNSITNLVLACTKCNQQKADKILNEVKQRPSAKDETKNIRQPLFIGG